MDRNEVFDALSTASLAIRLTWASLEIMTDDVENIQLLICGGEDVEAVKVVCAQGRLTVEQPAFALPGRPNSPRWMTVLLRLPRTWKGALRVNSASGPVSVRNLTGTDLSLETVSGPLRAYCLQGLTASLHTVSADVQAEEVSAEKLSLRSVSGDMYVRGAFRRIRLAGGAGDVTMELTEPFDALDAIMVSGDLCVSAPIDVAEVAMRGVSGKLRTDGVSIHEGGAKVAVSSVSGNVTLNSTL